MSEEPRAKNVVSVAPTTTLVYKKYFALLGLIAGLVLFFGTPPLVLQYHEGFQSNYNRQWVESLPDWVAASMLLLGMAGGVVIILVSSLLGMFIPSHVIRQQESCSAGQAKIAE